MQLFTDLVRRTRFSRRTNAVRGIVLMVMLSLLAIFTVMAVTFVVASGQFRRGAAIAAKAEQSGDTFEVLLQQALMQIVRGSEHPQSVIGPHSLLEDMYGQSDSVVGCVWFTPAVTDEAQQDIMTDWRSNYQNSPDSFLVKFIAYSFGQDRLPGVALSDDDGNGIVDDVSEVTFRTKQGDDCFLGSTPAHPLTQAVPEPGVTIDNWKIKPSGPLPIVDNVDNYYAGRVITFMSGAAAGQSCYIVRSKIVASSPSDLSQGVYTELMITPPSNGKLPAVTYDTGNAREFDRFVINGRPFNGRGFGATPYTFNGKLLPDGLKPSTITAYRGTELDYVSNASSSSNPQIIPNPKLRMLDHLYWSPGEPSGASMQLTGKQVPVAYTPNPVDVGMRDYLNRYAPFVEADEDYDAPDMQNMLLAYRQWNPRTRNFETIAPSLHRPDLVNYFLRSRLTPVSPAETSPADRKWYHLPPGIRRRIILRPDPVDHYDYTQEDTLNPKNTDGWTPGEPFDDWNQNGICDLALGEWDAQRHDINKNNIYDIGDRPFINPNFNAINGPWDVDNDGDGSPDSILVDLGMPVITSSDGKSVKPLFAVMVLDLDGRVNFNAHGTHKHYDMVTSEMQSKVDAIGQWKSNASNTVPDNSSVPVHSSVTTEDRYFIGAYGYALTQTTNLRKISVTRDPIIGSGLFPGAGDADTRFWATAYNQDYPLQEFGSDYRSGNVTVTGVQATRIQPAFGQGYSPADVNLAPVLWVDHYCLPSLIPSATKTLGDTPRRSHYYRRVLEGYFDNVTNTSNLNPVVGRYGESHFTRGELMVRPGTPFAPRAGATRSKFNTDTENGLLLSIFPVDTSTQFPDGRNAESLYQNNNDDDMPAPPTRTGDLLGNSARDAFGHVRQGDYGSPGDFQSGGAVGLDLRGQPIYLGLADKDGAIDEPTEINLNRRYFPKFKAGDGVGPDGADPLTGYSSRSGNLAYRDAPYTPAELERLIRLREPNSAGLSNRLVDMFDEDWYISYLVTTESWDLPCPHVAPTPELTAALRDLNLPIGNPTIGDLLRARFYLAHGANVSRCDAPRSASLATIAMRSYGYKSNTPSDLEIANNRSRLISPDISLGLRMDINAPFGNSYDDDNDGIVDEPWEGPEMLTTPPPRATELNYDGNRDGNMQPLPPRMQPSVSFKREFENPRQQFAKELYCLMMLLVDQNYVMPAPQALTSDPDDPNVKTQNEQVASVNLIGGSGKPQHFADSLFWSLNNLAEDQDHNADPNATITNDDTNLDYVKAKRWMTARRLAQWAINVVDFRDRDSIMSPFEFDVDPFNENDPSSGNQIDISGNSQSNSTWDVDGDLTTDENIALVAVTPGNWVRGVVWGCEYPDLLLTETLAFHDRRTANTMAEHDDPAITGTNKFCRLNSNGDLVPNDGGTPPVPFDRHWDQVRVPEGSAFIELYATGNPNLIGKTVDAFGNVTKTSMLPRELYSPLGRLMLAQSVSDGGGNFYPVWRMAITQGRIRNDDGVVSLPQNDVAMRLAKISPSSCSLDPADPGFSILPWVNSAATTSDAVIIERVVTFCSSGGPVITATAGLNVSQTPGKMTSTAGIDVYFTQTGVNGEVLPGRYVVVGPHRGAHLGDITTIGRTTKTGLEVTSDSSGGSSQKQVVELSGTQPEGVLALIGSANNSAFVATSPNGTNEYPIFGLDDLKTTLTSTTQPITWAGANMVLGGLYNSSGTCNTKTIPDYCQIQQPFAVGCSADASSSGGGSGSGVQLYSSTIGFNISEPTIAERNSTQNPYKDQKSTGVISLTDHRDEWQPDLQRKDLLSPPDDVPWDGYFDTASGEIVTNPQLPMLKDSTTLRYKSVFLQRLADPTQPWHPQANPYLTIDWMPFDLTVFNGEPWWLATDKNAQLQAFTEIVGKKDQNPFDEEGMKRPKPADETATAFDTRVRFGSRQRGSPRRPFKGRYSYFNLWGQPDWLEDNSLSSTLPPLTAQVNSNSVVAERYDLGTSGVDPYNSAQYLCKWQDPLQHTLGYINESYQYMMYYPMGYNPRKIASIVKRPVGRPEARSFNDATKGWLMSCDLGGDGANNPDLPLRYVGDPWRPFNWLTWNNRPFSGVMELMQVPAVGPSRLLYEFDMRRNKLPGGIANAATPPTAAPTPTDNNFAPWDPTRASVHYLPPISMEGQPGYIVRPPFGHLLNFFESSTTAAWGQLPISWTATGNPQLYSGGNFYRIFEYLTVPSRFSGTRQAARNSLFNNSYGGTDAKGNAYPWPFVGNEHPGWPFTAPFNMISAYREPGRVNLNTMPIMPERTFGVSDNPAGYPERNRDHGAAVWRAVTNEFHPKVRWVIGSNEMSKRYNRAFWNNDSDFDKQPFQSPIKSVLLATIQNGPRNTSIGLFGSGATDYSWNPSQDTAENFHNLYASLHSDNPNYDPRGPDGRIGGSFDSRTQIPSNQPGPRYGSMYDLPAVGQWISTETQGDPTGTAVTELDDTIWWPLEKRCDPHRQSLFNNPFRSFSEDGAVPPAIGYTGGTGLTPLPPYLSSASRVSVVNPSSNTDQTGDPNATNPQQFPTPLLSIDSTLLRRRDTLWSPWSTSNVKIWPQAGGGNAAKIRIRGSDVYYDPAFDPLFALNFPRPFTANGANNLFSGHTSPLLYTDAVPAGGLADVRLSRQSDYRNTDRSPFFRYQLYNKLSNIATTRSNVYAIWVTLVYFEVERVDMRVPLPSQENGAFGGFMRADDMSMSYRYPDGYRLIRELGSETGESDRHKAFAIFDRTIPVGFLRGENLNVDQGFLVRHILY